MNNMSLYVDVSDAVIASDILYYISNKLHNTPVKTVVTTCHNFYTDETYVFNEKKKLCDATNEMCSARRNENKRYCNIEDICAILSRRDSQNLPIPKFASLNLSNVPTNESGDPSPGQLMAAIIEIKRNMVTTSMLASSLSDFKNEISSSAPVITTSELSSSPVSDQPVQPPPPPFAPDRPHLTAHSHAIKPNILVSSSTLSPSAPSFNAVVAEEASVRDGGGGVGRGRGRGGGGRGRGGRNGQRESSQSRRQFKRGSSNASQSRVIIGKKVNEGLLSVKGADLTVNKYIGRLHNDVSIDDMRQFLEGQNVSVIELQQLLTKHDRFKSFRLRVKRDDLKIMEERDFWPEGVLCGPYFRPKTSEERHNANGGTTASRDVNNDGQ